MHTVSLCNYYLVYGSQQHKLGRWLYCSFSFSSSLLCLPIMKCACACVRVCVVLGIYTLWTICSNIACWAKINPACRSRKDTSTHTHIPSTSFSRSAVWLVLHIVISLHLHVCCCITVVPSRPACVHLSSLLPSLSSLLFLLLLCWLICFLPACLSLNAHHALHLSLEQLAPSLQSLHQEASSKP